MQLPIAVPPKPGVLFKSHHAGLSYFLFHEGSQPRGPFYLTVSELEDTGLFHIADIRQDSYSGSVVGSGFLAKTSHTGNGVYCLAFTGVFARQVDTRTQVDVTDFTLILKTKHFYVWSKRGYATLIVTPTLAESIRENLEL